MSGNKIGGLKAAAANKAKDPDFYKKLGKKGGSAHSKGGFAYLAKNDPEQLRELGAKGGTKSRRGAAK